MQYSDHSYNHQRLNDFLMIPSLHGSEEKVIVGISNSTLAKSGIHGNLDLSFGDSQRMAGAFATLAYRLPVRTYDLIDWIASDPHFNREAIAHYAKDHLGMKRVGGRSRSA